MVRLQPLIDDDSPVLPMLDEIAARTGTSRNQAARLVLEVVASTCWPSLRDAVLTANAGMAAESGGEKA